MSTDMVKGRKDKDKAAKSRRHPDWISTAFIVMACLLRSEKLQKLHQKSLFWAHKAVEIEI